MRISVQLSHLFLSSLQYAHSRPFLCDSSHKVQGLIIPSRNIHKLYSAAFSPPSVPAEFSLFLMCSPSSAGGSIRGIEQKQNGTRSSYPLCPLFSSSSTSSFSFSSSSLVLLLSVAHSVLAGGRVQTGPGLLVRIFCCQDPCVLYGVYVHMSACVCVYERNSVCEIALSAATVQEPNEISSPV